MPWRQSPTLSGLKPDKRLYAGGSDRILVQPKPRRSVKPLTALLRPILALIVSR